MKASNKMKFLIETHSYAPELNKFAIIHNGNVGNFIPCSGLTTIKQVREKFFKKPSFKKHCKIIKTFDDLNINTTCTETKKGCFDNYKSVLVVKRHLINRTGSGTVLHDGSVMPECKISIKTVSEFI